MLTSIDPSWADQGGVIDRFAFLGTQEDINKEIKTCIIEWATDFFGMSDEELELKGKDYKQLRDDLREAEALC